MMKLRSAIQRVVVIWLSLTGLLYLTSVSFAAQEEKVIVSYSSRDFSVLPAHVAQTKGFFKEEGLDPVMVQMRPPVAGPALMNNEIQYTTTFGSMLNAIMQGMPAKLLGVMTEKPPYYIVARPGINSVMELRGKKIAAQPRGLSDRIAAEAILESKGIDLKEVQFVTIGGDLPVRMGVLTSGLADAVCLQPPGPVLLEKDGYRIIAGPNDVKVGSPTMGVTASVKRLMEKRAEVKKLLRAMLRGLRFIRERREDTVAIMAQWFALKPDIAAKSYDLILPGYSQDGSLTDATMQAIIDLRVQSLGLPRPASLDQVRDFTLVREAWREIK
ncbi:MAG TPA: ABC transporter substrate-binding protein [Candidatus Acidoferrales bacterium]|nr:ABC transporter substrate-binding protein [Candidatus Acidoferrales bacterium]